MNINITSLTQEIEELEKRIKAISTSHSTLAQIIAVRDSLDQVRSCLNDLKTTIEENNDGASQTELIALSQRIDIVENDISALQSSLSGTEDDISAIQDEISTINSCIGEHTTTITNLQTTQTSLQTAQTNLQTTQSSQASSINTNTNDIATNTTEINNLKTRVTVTESNIHALTNGIDVGTLEDRILVLENSLNQPIYQNTIVLRKYDENKNVIADVYFRLFTKKKLSNITDVLNALQTNNIPAIGYYNNRLVIGVYIDSGREIFHLSVIEFNVTDSKVSKIYGVFNMTMQPDESNWNYWIITKEIE